MKTSIIFAAVIISTIAAVTVLSFLYMEKTADYVVESLYMARESIERGEKTDALEQLTQKWDKKKKIIMCLINHRDVENVSISLIKAKQRAEGGEFDEALKEIEMSVFLVKELVEKERFSIENIF